MKAYEIVLRKALAASPIGSEQWNQMQADFRNRAFFSARVTEVRVLSAMREGVVESLRGNLSASDFRKEIRRVLFETDYKRPEGHEGTIRDLLTDRRLDLIYNTNREMAKGYVQHLQATSEGALAAFPAYELKRAERRKVPRDWAKTWQDKGGTIYRGGRMIALKTDPIWTRISRFGNPYPPFDFNSGMDIFSVSRRECLALGVIDEKTPQQKPPKLDFNGDLKVNIPNMRSDSLCGRILKKNFGDQVKIENSVVSWEGNIVQDLVAGRRNKVKLGEGYNGKSVSLSRQFFVEHGGKHLDPDEPYEHLEKQDFELVPWLWRKPDRVLPTRDPNRDQLELDTLDGWTLVMIVDGRNGIKSIQKRRSPRGSTT